MEMGPCKTFPKHPGLRYSTLAAAREAVSENKEATSMPKYVAALDQGTTSTRCMLFDRNGAVAARSQKEHQQIYPQPGWVEHDGLEIWENAQEVMRAAVDKAGVKPDEIAAVGVTNQRETTIVWDRITGVPYTNAIVWQDTRTKTICCQLAEQGGIDRFRAKTGLPLATYFSGPKLKWILDNVEGVRQAAERGEALFGTIDSWLIWNLTGGRQGGAHVTDVTNASRTMLMDLEKLTWDSGILEILDIPESMLPRIVPSSDPEPWGSALEGNVPVCGDLGDQQAALVGQTCFGEGDAKNTYGTGCFMLLNTGQEIVHSKSGLITTVGYQLAGEPPVYALEGSIAIAGALVQWLRDNLGLIQRAPEVEALARSVDDNGGIYFVPAFSGLFAPHWRPDARGVIAGLTQYTHRGHLARAALEATAYQTREVLEAMEKDSGVRLTSLKVDGGMVYNGFLMQFQTDILGVPVVRPKITETTSLGAAYAAGLAAGFWSDLEELRAHWQMDQTWAPEMDRAESEKLYRGWQKAVQRTFDWVE
jgi:glycerol kinase